MELPLLERILIFVSLLPCKCVNSLFVFFLLLYLLLFFFFLLLYLFCVIFVSFLCVYYLQ